MPLIGSLSLNEPVAERALRAIGYDLRRGKVLDASLFSTLDDLAGFEADDAMTTAEPAPKTMVYGPAAHANRFQGLLYSAAAEHDIGLVPLRDFGELDELPVFGPFVLHLHWLTGITSNARDAEAAQAAVDAFLAGLDRLRERQRANVVWTAHNLLPHDSRFPELDSDFRQALIDRCDLIHCMTEHSVTSLADRFDLSGTRSFVVPHPSYEGAYPDYIDSASARAILGLPQDVSVVLSFGAVQRYKGYDTLRDAFDLLRARMTDHKVHLLIAGAPSDPAEVAALLEWAHLREDVMLLLEKINDDDLQLVFKSADVAVCPYRQTLNSGVAILALSYGVPVVAPDQGAFVSLNGQGVDVYDSAGGAAACAEAIATALREPGRDDENIARFIADHRPADISRAFFSQIGEIWR